MFYKLYYTTDSTCGSVEADLPKLDKETVFSVIGSDHD